MTLLETVDRILAAANQLQHFALQYWLPIAFVSGVCGLIFVLLRCNQNTEKVIVRLGGLSWTRADFCRGWLITGDTGSGKTRSGITPLLYQVFTNEPDWGGVCIDDKGLYWETLSSMATHFRREDDLLLLQVKPEDASFGWIPPQTFNLTGDRSIPANTYAKFVVDTASSLGQQDGKGFFKNQAQTHIAKALDVLCAIRADVTLENVHRLLLNEADLHAAIRELGEDESIPRHVALCEHFKNRFLNQPPEQLGGVKETIANYLQPYIAPEVAQIFSPSESSFGLEEIDRGKILCVSMPQKFQTERRYINTFLKMLFYTHVLRRFDKSKEDRLGDNLLILWADEAQRFMTSNEDGMSDYNSVDIIREAQGAVVAAAQSTTSFIPPLGKDKAKVLTLNLRNRMIFRAADEDGALESANFLGQKRVIKKTWGFAQGRKTYHYSEQEEHKLKPHELRSLAKHTCILVHAEQGFRKRILHPIEPDGTVCDWF
ncbi:MAG: type IV secretion system DNA-binding domain-containing protein [Verrucomicrobiota bacterium]